MAEIIHVKKKRKYQFIYATHKLFRLFFLKILPSSGLFQEISISCDKAELSSEDRDKLLILQSKWDDKRLEGAFVRLQAKWIEKGVKNRQLHI